MPSPNRILLIRPSALGDVCRTVPVLVSLRRRYPRAIIDWVVQDGFIDAIQHHPDLTNALAFPRRRFAAWWRTPRVTRELIGWLLDLRRAKYDLVFDLQGLSRSALIMLCTGAPRRVVDRGCRELAWLAGNRRHTLPENLHTVDHMLELIRAEGVEAVRDMRLYTGDGERAWWREQTPKHGLQDTPYAVLAPTSRWPSKRWPAPMWRDILKPLIERGYEKLVIVGGPGEHDQLDGLLPDDDPSLDQRLVDLVGRTSIGQMMAVIEQAGLVIANDSAPLHMAVGYDRPCIGLFGPTDPAIVGPYQRDSAVLREVGAEEAHSAAFNYRRMDDRLMRRIRPEAVLDRVDHVGSIMRPTPEDPIAPGRPAAQRDAAADSTIAAGPECEP